MEINIDQIENLGSFIEIEMVSEDPKYASKQILEFLENKLNVSKESIITEGYVPMMIRRNEDKDE